MHLSCQKDPKFKEEEEVKTKFLPRQFGDLSLTYILQVFEGDYLAQVMIDNFHPLGHLDHWNLTWEWMKGEFIFNMRGAYTRKKDPSECIYGPQGQYYQGMDFTPVMNCVKGGLSSLVFLRRKLMMRKLGSCPFVARMELSCPPP
ncbi:unnamed protein product [Camellia sinensis]